MSDLAVRPTDTRRRWESIPASSWIGVTLLFSLTMLVYLPCVQGRWIWGDNERVYANPLLKDAEGLQKIWLSREPKDYWPLFYSAFWIQWRLWGQSTLGYHLVNILWHALVVVLLWRVLKRLGVRGAWPAAAIFAVHPMHVDSVAWISEFVNPFSASFCLAGLLCYLRCDERDGWGWYAGSLVLFLLAMLSKASVATLPAIIVLCRLWMGRAWRWKEGVRLGGLAVVAIVLSAVTIWFQKYSAAAVGREWSAGFWERTAVAGHIVWFYLFKTLVPYSLMFVYPKWRIDPTSIVSYLPAMAVIVTALVCAWKWRSWGRSAFVGLGAFLVLLLPVLGYFNMFYMKYSYVADHWNYLASMPLIASAVAWASAGLEKGRHRFRGRSTSWLVYADAILVMGVVAILGTMTWRHSATYTDLERIWRATLAVDNDVAMPHANLGALLCRRAQALEDQVGRRPDEETRAKIEALYREAEHHYRESLRIQPDDEDSHANLGAILFRRGDVAGALSHYHKALEIDPMCAHAHANLAKALLKRGHLDESIKHFDAVARIEPHRSSAQTDLAGVLTLRGRWAEAAACYRRALELTPDDPVALHRYAWLLATCPDDAIRDGRRALALAEHACVLTRRRDPMALDSLAAAYAEMGLYDKATTTAAEAMELMKRQAATPLMDRMTRRAASYAAGRPHRSEALPDRTEIIVPSKSE